MLTPEDSSVLWLVIVGFIIAFILAFGIGANDVANSFGTSVGAKVLTLFQACVIACIFEMAGCILIGSKVSNTVRKGIIDINRFNGTEEMAMVGSFSALTATSVWLLVATFLNLPVSGTHSIVGAVIGYALVAFSGEGITWSTFGKIASSWVISPLLSGSISSGIFVLLDRFILRKDDPLKYGLLALPFLTGGTIFINIFSILLSNSDVFGITLLRWWGILLICLLLSLLLGGVVHVAVNPWLKRKILYTQGLQQFTVQQKEAAKSNGVKEEGAGGGGGVEAKYMVQTPELKRIKDENANNDDTSSVSNTSHYTISGLEIDRKRLIRFDSGRKSRRSLPNPKTMTSEIPSEECVPTAQVGVRDDDENDYKRKNTSGLKEAESKNSIWSTRSSRAESVRSRTESFMLANLTKSTEDVRAKVVDDPRAAQLFKYLQILTASFGAFAHGGNDVSNAIGPAISLYLIYKSGVVDSTAGTPIWILLYGGFGIIIGLCVWGRRVIETVGENLSPITPSSGFSIEIGSALTVLLASNIGIPISTTHCKVGSVVMVGRVRSKEVVDWSLFGNIAVSWIVTMPITEEGLQAKNIYHKLKSAEVDVVSTTSGVSRFIQPRQVISDEDTLK